MRKSTGDLFQELQKSPCELGKYLKNNPESFVENDIKTFWEAMIQKSGRSKSNIINKADFSYCYFYDVINGRKSPSRDKVVRLILSMQLSLDDCQQALKISGKSCLYPRVKRDSILIYAIENRLSVFQLSELLAQYGEEELK